MKKTLILGLSALMALSLVTADSGTAFAQDAEQEVITLRIGTQAPKGTPWGKLLRRMRKRFRDATKGKEGMPLIKVKLYWLGKLGSENKLVRRCQKGSVDGIAVSVGALGNAIPELNLIEAPYMFKSEKDAYAKLAKATPIVKELMAAKGMKFIIWGENGFRHFMHKEKFLDKKSALRGVKMRSQPSEPHKKMYSALGAAASTIAIGELKQSLDNDVVAGFDNSYIYTYATGLHKEIKYVAETKHIYQPAIVSWCDKALAAKIAKFPKLMDILMDVPSSWEAEGRRAVSVMNNKLIPKQFEKAGIQIKKLSAGELAALKGATSSVLGKLAKSPKGRELLQKLK